MDYVAQISIVHNLESSEDDKSFQDFLYFFPKFKKVITKAGSSKAKTSKFENVFTMKFFNKRKYILFYNNLFNTKNYTDRVLFVIPEKIARNHVTLLSFSRARGHVISCPDFSIFRNNK